MDLWQLRCAAHCLSVCLSVCLSGDRLGVVGSDDALGSWDTRKAVVLTTDGDTFPVWKSSEVLLPCGGGRGIQYKYVVCRGNGTVLWEPFDGTDGPKIDESHKPHVCLLYVIMTR